MSPQKPKTVSGGLVELVVIVAVALGLALGIQWLLVKPYRIPSESMEPTLTKGQRILVNRLGNRFNDPKVGEIMVFHPPKGADDSLCGNPQQGPDQDHHACTVPTKDRSSQNFVKRVVGLPGDTLLIRGGHVIRNGKPANEPFVKNPPCEPDPSGCNLPQFKVPPGMYFMMGDNRGASLDSRFWGPVPRAWIIGGAFFTYWPPNRIGFL